MDEVPRNWDFPPLVLVNVKLPNSIEYVALGSEMIDKLFINSVDGACETP